MNYSYYGYDTSSYLNSSSTSNMTGLSSSLQAITTMLLTYSVIILVIAVIQIIAMWKVFTKAGEKGWKSIIPIYNVITLFKISGISPLLILVYLAGFIPFIGPIACLVLTIYQANRLSKSFGKTAGFTVGLVLLAPIFYMILAFGKSEYVGTVKE